MAVTLKNPAVEKQARELAKDNREAEPDVTKIFWFPDEHEVRLLEITEQIPITLDGQVWPFYFPASPQDNLPLPTATAMIRANEVGKLKLPPEWGDWNDAVEL